MKNFDSIPSTEPATNLLDKVQIPEDMRNFSDDELLQLADELREYLLYVVGQTGGHFGAGLGVVELTIALHYIFQTPDDRLVWDVGHQAYPHKILTARRDRILSLRQRDGLSGFPSRTESPFDTFGVGHSSTSISAALGMAMASKLKGEDRKHVAVIGDGAMTAGMAFEALNHVAGSGADMMVVLNDNNMSISENVGALSSYFSRIWASKLYNQIRREGQKVLSRVPPASEFVRRTEEHMKGMVSPGTFFEEMGFNYIGPMDGHNLKSLVDTLQNLRDLKEPILLHVITEKGRGFTPAEEDPIGYHALAKIEPKTPKAESTATEPAPKKKKLKYQDVFGQWLCDMAAMDQSLVGITPAMREGSGMVEFSKTFPDRYVDVGIAEQHSVTLAAGMACENIKPVVAIYSTFLQRAYDQLIHDVALQDLDVLFALDRAGLVGEDGASHAGAYDISYLRCIPNMLVMTPSDEDECRKLLTTGYLHKGPAAVRYPRGTGTGVEIDKELTPLPIGKAIVRRHSQSSDTKVALLVFGTLLSEALVAAEQAEATVVDMRFAKPIDEALLSDLADSHTQFVTLEENALAGGAGSAVMEYVNRANLKLKVTSLGLPDKFQHQATRAQLLAEAGIDAASIVATLKGL